MQVLLNPDGTYPAHLDAEAIAVLTEAGAVFTVPVPPPAPEPGHVVQEGEPELVDGQWRQTWVQVPAAPALSRAEWRQTVRLDRRTFCGALRGAGILNGPEMVTAAKGEWPQSFADALEGLPVDPWDAQADWAAATHVARLNPLFLAVLGYYAAQQGLTAEQAEALGDSIFGWQA